MVKKRFLSISIFFVLAIILLSGCGQSEATNETANETLPDNNEETGEETSTDDPSNISAQLNLGSGGVGSSKHAIGTGISSVFSEHSDVNITNTTSSGSLEWYSMMLTGEIELGITGDLEADAALQGIGEFEEISGGEGIDTRMIASGNLLYTGILVAEDSGIDSAEDLIGKRVTLTYGSGGYSIQEQPAAFFANLGLNADDVTDVPLTDSTSEAPQAIIEGRIDAAPAVSITGAAVAELDAAKGAKFLSLDDSQEAIERAREVLPTFEVGLVEPGSDKPGIEEPIYLMEYPFYLIGVTDLSNEVVYEITRVMWEHNEQLTAGPKPLDEWTREAFIVEEFAIPYHPGAIEFYEEVGVWTPELAERQEMLLEEF